MASDLVTSQCLERELEFLRSSAVNSRFGIFGPQSAIWRIDREAATFLGAGRALLLQLAHPWVASAIGQTSNALADPIGRFLRTFNIVFKMVFGNLEDSLAAARQLHRRHTKITGVLTTTAGPFAAGSRYFANSVPALRWVWATLTDSAFLAYCLVNPPPSKRTRDQYYSDSVRFAALFGIPAKQLPSDWASFLAYFNEMVHSDILTVTSSTRSIAHDLLPTADIRIPITDSYRALTIQLLPPLLRKAYALPYGADERRRAERIVRWVRRAYPFLPERVRYIGPYFEARNRIIGDPKLNYLTQASNRFWIGRRRLSSH